MRADERVTLGRTGLRVSRMGLGLASLGGMFRTVPEAEAQATIDRAWELGVLLTRIPSVVRSSGGGFPTRLAIQVRPEATGKPRTSPG